MRPLTPDGQTSFLASLFFDLEANPNAANLWATLVIVGVQWLSDESLARVETAAKSLRYPDGRPDEAAKMLWHAVSAALPYLSDECRAHIRQGLVQWAGRLAELHAVPVVSPYGNSPASEDAELVVDIALSMCRKDRLKESLDELANLIAELMPAWPALVPSWRDLFTRAFREAPNSDTEGLWRTYIKLRSAP